MTVGRPRREETEVKIHQAALALLRSQGPTAVTIDAVAHASGVAKTTIYRRYVDRDEMLRGALASTVSIPVASPGETVDEKLRWALGETWRHMSDVLGMGGVAAIIGGAHPNFAALANSVLSPSMDALTSLIREDIDAGEVRADLDPSTLVSVLMGAYVGEVLRNGSVGESFLDECVALLWRGIATSGVAPGDAARSNAAVTASLA